MESPSQRTPPATEQSGDDRGTVSVLLRHARGGCAESRERLLQRFRDYLLFLAKDSRDPKWAGKVGVSDIVQQSLVQVDSHFETFRGDNEAQWKAWLKTLLLNEVRQTHRHFLRDKRAVAKEVELDCGKGTEAATPKRPESPLTQAIQHEQLQALRSAIDRLSNDYRTVIQLRSLDRLPMAEVARRMDRSTEATAKLWYRAVLKLRSLMPDVDRSQ